MCGLFGFSLNDKKPVNLNIAAAVLCQCASDRGEDSWGIIAGEKVYKGLGSITKAKFPRTLSKWPLVAGHTRFATAGKITLQNAHPFAIGNIIGMHNGIVYNHMELDVEYDRYCEVDSEHIFYHIDENKPLDDIEAYGAIVYSRSDTPNTLFMGRFNGGELSVARIRQQNGEPIGVMWSSTRKALSNAISLAGFKAKYVEIEQGKLYSVHDGEVYTTNTVLNIDKKYETAKVSSSSYSNGPYSGYFKNGKWTALPPATKELKQTSWQPTCEPYTYEQDEAIRAGRSSDLQSCDSCGEYGKNCFCGTDCFCAHCLNQSDRWDYTGRDIDKEYADRDTPPETYDNDTGWTSSEGNVYPGFAGVYGAHTPTYRSQEERRIDKQLEEMKLANAAPTSAQLSLPAPKGE